MAPHSGFQGKLHISHRLYMVEQLMGKEIESQSLNDWIYTSKRYRAANEIEFL